jgi:hypothetical protein
MTVEHVPQEKPQHRQPFSASENPHRETDAVTPRLKNPLIEKCLKQLVKKGLFGRPYVKDYLYVTCLPLIHHSNLTCGSVFGGQVSFEMLF